MSQREDHGHRMKMFLFGYDNFYLSVSAAVIGLLVQHFSSSSFGELTKHWLCLRRLAIAFHLSKG